MHQVLFTIPIFGGVRVFGFGTMLVLAFVSSTWLAWWRARREHLDPEVILDMAFWVFLSGLVGARLFYCIEYWGSEINSLWDVFQYWKGGIVYYGGILGASAAFFVYRHFRPFPVAALHGCAGAVDRDRNAVRPAGLFPERVLLRRPVPASLGGLLPQALASLGPPSCPGADPPECHSIAAGPSDPALLGPRRT